MTVSQIPSSSQTRSTGPTLDVTLKRNKSNVKGEGGEEKSVGKGGAPRPLTYFVVGAEVIHIKLM